LPGYLLTAQTKDDGPAHLQMSYWQYQQDGSGTMFHGEAAGAANHTYANPIDEIRIGWAANRGNGDIAAVGLWTRQLAPEELDTLKTNLLSAWAALAPDELISFENWDGTTGWATLIGSSVMDPDLTEGSVTVGSNPTGFDFEISTETDLAIDNAAHVHSAQNVTLTQLHQLGIASAIHAQTAQNLALTQLHNLAIANAAHTITSTTIGSLIPDAGTVSGAAVANPTLKGSSAARPVVALAGTIE